MLMRQLLLTISASAVLLPSYIRADEGNYTCSCRCCCYGECSGSNEKLVEDCLECLKCDRGVTVFTGDFTSELTTTATTVGSNYSTTLRSSDQSTHSSLSICMDKCLNSSRESECNVPPENLELIVSLSVLCGTLLAAVVILTVACVHRYGCRCRRCWRRKSNPPMLPSISFVDARLSDCRPPSTTPTSDEKCRAGPDDPWMSNNNGSSNAGFSNGRQLPPVCRTRDEDTDVDLQKKKVSRGSVESEAGSLSGANLLFRNGKYVYEVKKVFERQSDTACSPPVSNKEAKASVSSTKTIGGNGNNSAVAAETGRPSNSITNKVAMPPPSVSRPSLSKPQVIPPVGPSTTSKPSCCPTAGKKLPSSEKPKPSKSKGGNSDSSSGSSSSLEYSYAELPEEVLARQEAFIKSMLTASKSPKPRPTVPRVSPKKEPKLYINV